MSCNNPKSTITPLTRREQVILDGLECGQNIETIRRRFRKSMTDAEFNRILRSAQEKASFIESLEAEGHEWIGCILDIDTYTVSALTKAGIIYSDELKDMDRDEVMSIPGIGEKRFRVICRYCNWDYDGQAKANDIAHSSFRSAAWDKRIPEPDRWLERLTHREIYELELLGRKARFWEANEVWEKLTEIVLESISFEEMIERSEFLNKR